MRAMIVAMLVACADLGADSGESGAAPVVLDGCGVEHGEAVVRCGEYAEVEVGPRWRVLACNGTDGMAPICTEVTQHYPAIGGIVAVDYTSAADSSGCEARIYW